MASKLKKHNSKWSFRYKDASGVHKRFICKSPIHARASQERIDFLNKNPEGIIKPLISSEYDIETLYWNQFCHLYKQYVINNKKDVRTDNRIIKLISEIINPTFLKDLNTFNIRYFISQRESTGIKKSTVNREMNCIRSMWTYAIKTLKVNYPHQAEPIKKYKTKRVVKERILTLEEIQKCKTEIDNEQMLTAFYLMIYLGLRLKEAFMLKWHYVNFKTNLVGIEPQKTEDTDPDISYIPMREYLRNYLLNLKNKYPDAEYVIPQNRPYLTTYYSRLLSELFKKLELENVTAHILRHTYISYLFMYCKKLSDIMDWARITDIKTLKVYKHLTPQYQENGINDLPY